MLRSLDLLSSVLTSKKFIMSEPAEKKARVPIKLGYWNIRAFAQPIRYLLKYTGAEFENDFYEEGDAPDYKCEAWMSVRCTLGLDFPNLPYLIDGETKLTQSNAILRYIARKYDLCGKTDSQKTVVDLLECEALDFREGFGSLCYSPQFDDRRDGYVTKVKGKIKQFSDYLGQKDWFSGNEVTYVDFILYEILFQHHAFQPDLVDDFSNIKDFFKRFEALPGIKEYMESPEFKKLPFQNKSSHWGGKLS